MPAPAGSSPSIRSAAVARHRKREKLLLVLGACSVIEGYCGNVSDVNDAVVVKVRDEIPASVARSRVVCISNCCNVNNIDLVVTVHIAQELGIGYEEG